MIVSFADKETEKVFYEITSTKLPNNIQRQASRKLRLLNCAISVTDLSSIPGNRFEKLKGNLEGKWSIRINSQWRIIFSINDDGDFEEVEIVDYH